MFVVLVINTYSICIINIRCLFVHHWCSCVPPLLAINTCLPSKSAINTLTTLWVFTLCVLCVTQHAVRVFVCVYVSSCSMTAVYVRFVACDRSLPQTLASPRRVSWQWLRKVSGCWNLPPNLPRVSTRTLMLSISPSLHLSLLNPTMRHSSGPSHQVRGARCLSGRYTSWGVGCVGCRVGRGAWGVGPESARTVTYICGPLLIGCRPSDFFKRLLVK